MGREGGPCSPENGEGGRPGTVSIVKQETSTMMSLKRHISHVEKSGRHSTVELYHMVGLYARDQYYPFSSCHPSIVKFSSMQLLFVCSNSSVFIHVNMFHPYRVFQYYHSHSQDHDDVININYVVNSIVHFNPCD
jgi:hypothetical protein